MPQCQPAKQSGAIAGDDHDVGFRITDTTGPDGAAGNVHYGWLRFDTDLTNYAITITEFAIEDSGCGSVDAARRAPSRARGVVPRALSTLQCSRCC